MQAFLDNFADISALLRVYPLLLQGLVYTVTLAFIALPLGLLLGLAIAVAYSFHHRWVNIALLVDIDLFRSFPVVVLLILIYYGLPFLGLTLGGFAAAVLAIVLNNSGYYGEILRAGIEFGRQRPTGRGSSVGLQTLACRLLYYSATGSAQCAGAACQQFPRTNQDHIHWRAGRSA